ncbi:intracellular exo-alpha-(1-_5)-L-arabinofuranosidase 1 [Clostridia bacterium]|nr:intracellular exo-alpha-(1->5)-L-arabinofuranosidase 1 [Clostridia bacterium]
MEKIKIFADKNLSIGVVEDKVFGSFLEHLGRAVYTGIYEPGHPGADKNGFRSDTAALIKELNVPVIRYPGGNFVSGYNWRDGVGPKNLRPRRLDLAWRTTETNQFGTDEFMKWCGLYGIEPMMAVNLGTGSIAEAQALTEYCNFPAGTQLSDMRIANGAQKPYGVKYWCLGNEMDGPWQMGHLSAEDYAKKALEAAKLMRLTDESIELIACGSSNIDMPTYPDWDRTVLEYLYDDADYISMHQYYYGNGSDADFFASYKRMDDFIRTIKAACDLVRAKRRSSKLMKISFDEWNVWYQKRVKLKDWEEAPEILEDIYSLKDALVFGGLLNTLINNCDRVKMAALAQLVNVIAPIFTAKGGAAIRQTIFYPFKLASLYGRGRALTTINTSPCFDSSYGQAKFLSESVVENRDGSVSVFCVNYSEKPVQAEIELRSFGALKATEHKVLSGSDLDAVNTFAHPDAVKPADIEPAAFKDGVMHVKFPAMSWNMIRLQ